MQGTVMAFSRELSVGYIIGEDGNEYIFKARHWRCEARPSSALEVSFEAAAGEALNVTRN